MADVKWIKIVVDIFDDEKILLIESMPESDSIIVIWFKLLCLAGKQNNSGVFTLGGHIPYTDEMFSTIFRRPINTVRMALQTFEKFGMVEVINNTVTIPNWGKHQSIEQIEARREYQRQYHIEYRKRQKLLTEGTDDGKGLRKHLREDDVNTPDKNREDKNRLDKKESKEKTVSRFSPPTVDEVAEYCKERGNNINPEGFVDFYESKGWKIGSQSMKDWKAAVRTWERRESNPAQDKRPRGQKVVTAQQYDQRHYSEEELASLTDDPILTALEARYGA